MPVVKNMKRNIKFLMKAIALRKTFQEKEDIVKLLDDAISNLKMEKRDFKWFLSYIAIVSCCYYQGLA